MAGPDVGTIPQGLEGVANGVATLGSDGKLKSAQVPAPALGTPFTAASQAAMLALSTAVANDTCYRSDTLAYYRLSATPASTLANWIPTGSGVTSVAGKTGAVTLANTDITGLGNAATKTVGTTTGTVADGLALANEITRATAAEATLTTAVTAAAAAAAAHSSPDVQYLPATDFPIGLNGSRTVTAGSGGSANGYPGVSLPNSATTDLLKMWSPPAGWTTFDVRFWWMKDGSGTGDVMFEWFSIDEAVDGTTTTTSFVPITTAVTAVSGSGIKMQRSLIASGQTFAATAEIIRVGFGRLGSDAADTYNGASPIRVVMVELTRTNP